MSDWQRLLLLCVVYPVLEEWAFRGELQTRLLKRRRGRMAWHGITGANVLTTLLFSAAHLFLHPPLWALLVAPPSLVFGWFRDKYQSLLPGTLLHIMYNTGYFLLFHPAA